MGTKIIKIDLEMAEKIEFKDLNVKFKLFCCCQKIFFFIKNAITFLRNTNFIKVGGFRKLRKFAN